jgi:hypothetical protein
LITRGEAAYRKYAMAMITRITTTINGIYIFSLLP